MNKKNSYTRKDLVQVVDTLCHEITYDSPILKYRNMFIYHDKESISFLIRQIIMSLDCDAICKIFKIESKGLKAKIKKINKFLN